LILFVQTFGDLLTFNPHIHVLAADGVFRADGAFVVLPAIPVKLLRAPLRSVAVQAAEDGQLVAARATGARKGHRRIKTAGARTDLPSRSRHRLSC